MSAPPRIPGVELPPEITREKIAELLNTPMRPELERMVTACRSKFYQMMGEAFEKSTAPLVEGLRLANAMANLDPADLAAPPTPTTTPPPKQSPPPKKVVKRRKKAPTLDGLNRGPAPAADVA